MSTYVTSSDYTKGRNDLRMIKLEDDSNPQLMEGYSDHRSCT